MAHSCNKGVDALWRTVKIESITKTKIQRITVAITNRKVTME